MTPAGEAGRGPRVAIAGWIGSTNLGDELIARAVYGRLTELGAEPLAITIDPQRTGALLGAAGVEHHRIRDTPGLIRALRSVDGVVFGGGGLVQDETGPLNLPFHLGRLALGRVLRKPWVGVGLGVGTVSRRTGRQLVRRVMSGAQAITVRDPASQQRLLALGVESVLAADPVVAWPEAEEAPGTDDVLAVSVRRPNLPGQRTLSSAPPLDEEWLGRMSGAIEAVAIDLGLGVRFVAFEADQDGDLHRRLAERIAVESELVEPTVDTVLGAVGRASAVFTMRYHGAIAALRRGRPAILVDYSPKMADLSADLAQAMPALPVGLPDAGTAVEAMNRAVSRAGDLPGHLDRLVTREAANAATLEALVATDGG
ncbi:MAG: polysaccharide pyruvyl transferase family protein [Candidatus Microthrix sp.]|nr:polysaccharide pyruvyl transferase family protein [Candidatus Microthrix sp.]MBK6503244.1 polysaccharide pyruvyl transferase family protein [Candidatus Microthrix sp.]